MKTADVVCVWPFPIQFQDYDLIFLDNDVTSMHLSFEKNVDEVKTTERSCDFE